MRENKDLILIVDDDKQYAESLAGLLERKGYDVHLAENSSETLNFLESQTCKLVVVDWYLGENSEMDGIKLTRNIRKNYPQVKIVELTKHGDKKLYEQALKAGADRFIHKTAEPREIIQIIDSLEEMEELRKQLETSTPENYWLHQMITQSESGISVIDRTYRILFVNDSLQRMFPYKLHVGGICWVEFHQNEKQKEPCPFCPLKNWFEKGEPSPKGTNLSPVGKGRDLRYLDLTGSPIKDKNEKIIGAVKIATDVTAREELIQITEDIEIQKRLTDRLRIILEGIQRLANYDRLRIYSFSEDGQGLDGLVGIEETRANCTFDKKISCDKYPCFQEAFKNKKVFLCNSNEFGQHPLDPDLKEWFLIPLIANGKPMGVIEIDNKINETKQLTLKLDEELIMKYAAHAAYAIETAREVQKVGDQSLKYEETNSCLTRLSEIETIIQRETELEKKLFLILIAVTMKWGLEFNHAMLLLINKESKTLDGKMGLGILDKNKWETIKNDPIWNDPGSFLDILNWISHEFDSDRKSKLSSPDNPLNEIVTNLSFPLNELGNILSRVIFEKETIYIRDAKKNLHADSFYTQLCEKGIETDEFILVPLISEKGVMGALYVDNRFDQRQISKTEEYLLTLFANQAAVALQNSFFLTELKTANEELSKISAYTAHKVGNQVFALRGNLDSCKKRLSAEPVNISNTKEPILTALETVDRLNLLVNDFKKLSKAEELQKEEMNINLLLEKEISRMIGSDSTIDREFSLDNSLPPIQGDQIKIGEVIQEIVKNGSAAMKNKGKFLIGSSVATQEDQRNFELDPARRFVKIEVSNSGPCFSAEAKKHLFTPYFTEKKDEGGTGLGLVIIKRIIESHGGRITAMDNSDGKGVRFTIFLPIE